MGAGAAGLFCAAELARHNRSALLLESGELAGRKLAVCGGGHANFTNLGVTAEHYLCQGYDAFPAAALAKFGPSDAMAFVAALGLQGVRKTHGRIFLRQPAKALATALARAAAQGGSSILCASRVTGVEKRGERFFLQTAREYYECKTLALALGSPARPLLADWQDGWQLAKALGHHVFAPEPALTRGIYIQPQKSLQDLTGISLEVELSISSPGWGRHTWLDDLLFTHDGVSGPAFFNASLYWQRDSAITVNFLPGFDLEAALDASPRKTARGILRELLPLRLVDALLTDDGSKKAAELSRSARKGLAARVHEFALPQCRLAGVNIAEVSRGGVDVSELDPQTMQSRLCPGLYILGEMAAVTGELGGYNLHWAFASATAAARSIAKRP